MFAGCDLGILSAKAAIVEDGEILASEILPYRNLPKEAAREAMDRVLAKVGRSAEWVDGCLATGFGKKAVPFADGEVSEMMSLHRAIREVNPRVRTVVDVGGHSFTAFHINDEGRITEFSITDKCASGTGKFLETMAKALEMPLEELSRTALGSTHPIPITNQCVILAESDVISHVNDGQDSVDIFAGVASYVANSIMGLITTIDVEAEVAMTGGVAKNPIVVRNLEAALGLELADLAGVDPQVLGAVGAALIAGERSI